MNIQRNNTGAHAAGFALLAVLTVGAPQCIRAQQGPGGGGQQAPAGPTGPMAPEKYKNIQVLTNVPADQMDLTMRYVSASVGMRCTECHVQETSGQMSFEKDDKRAKQTARQMMKMVYAINAGGFGVQAECATCHSGNNRPAGLPMATMLTPEQVAQMAPPPPTPGAGAGPQGAAGAPGGGRGRGPAAGPPVAEVTDKYFAAIGGRAAAEKLQSLSLTGTVTSRTGQSSPFTIEEKSNKYLETRQATPNATTRGFDGTAGWQRNGSNTGDLAGYQLDQALRLDDLGIVLHLNDKYTNVATSGRPMQVNGKDTTVVSGRVGPATEQFFFDSASGLLLRRVVATRTMLGTLREQIDYTDYRSVGDLKLPFEMKLTTYNTLDTYKVADAKVNMTLDDARFSKPK